MSKDEKRYVKGIAQILKKNGIRDEWFRSTLTKQCLNVFRSIKQAIKESIPVSAQKG